MIPIFLISAFYCITRLPFIRSFPVYYDSFEYIRIVEKLNWHNITSGITNSHQPIHTFYFLTSLLFKTLFFHSSVAFSMTMLSFLFGFATTIVWYVILKKIFQTKTAVFGTIVLLLFPLFFITNTNILYESELLFFQILSVYLLIEGIQKKRKMALFLSGLSLGLAHLVFIGTLYIIPLSLIILFIYFASSIMPFCVGIIITGIGVDFLFIQSIPLLIQKYLMHAGDVVSNDQGVVFLIGRAIRNILFQGTTVLSLGGFILLLIAGALLFSIKKYSRWRIFISIFIPFLILMQYWYAGLFGRLAMGIIFPSSFFITLIFDKTKKQIVVTTILLAFFVSTSWQQKKIPPIYQFYNLIRNEKNIVVITSDYNRFLYERFDIPYFVIKGESSRKEIKKYIEVNILIRTILIDSAALRYPYFQYDGDSYQILSKRSNGNPLIGTLLDAYIYKEYKRKPFSDIYFLHILSKKK